MNAKELTETLAAANIRQFADSIEDDSEMPGSVIIWAGAGKSGHCGRGGRPMTPLTRSQFAAALLMHRQRLGLTQAQAARLIDVSPRKWWQMEHGECDVRQREQRWTLDILGGSKIGGSK